MHGFVTTPRWCSESCRNALVCGGVSDLACRLTLRLMTPARAVVRRLHGVGTVAPASPSLTRLRARAAHRKPAGATVIAAPLKPSSRSYSRASVGLG